MSIKESGQMYLEAIFVLSKGLRPVRSIDVAEYLGYSKPSVSRAMGILKAEGYVVSDGGVLSLTEQGLEIARSMYARHTVLTQALTSLGVDAQTAAEDACRIEHVISEDTFEAIRSHIQWAEENR